MFAGGKMPYDRVILARAVPGYRQVADSERV